jgi:hypothetical protein
MVHITMERELTALRQRYWVSSRIWKEPLPDQRFGIAEQKEAPGVVARLISHV